MSVFLRWGVFGILAVAALIYAYNASKKMAENRGANPVHASAAADSSSDSETGGNAWVDAPVEVPARCQVEVQVAERALEARRDQEPLDKLLRVRVIAFEKDPVRRQRLEKVAADWYLREGEEPSSGTVLREVVADCEQLTPGP
jgi:hypothetical protein